MTRNNDHHHRLFTDRFLSEATDDQCPFCNHKLRFRQSPFFIGGCYGDTHFHYYCGKCHEYVCEICNPKMIDPTGKPMFHQFSNCKNWVY